MTDYTTNLTTPSQRHRYSTSAAPRTSRPGTVTIGGTVTEDQTLTASNTLTDADGMGTGPITYQWNRDGTAISGETGASYMLADADVGKTITVTASYTDGGGTLESVSSTATPAVANVNDAPDCHSGATGTVAECGFEHDHLHRDEAAISMWGQRHRRRRTDSKLHNRRKRTSRFRLLPTSNGSVSTHVQRHSTETAARSARQSDHVQSRLNVNDAPTAAPTGTLAGRPKTVACTYHGGRTSSSRLHGPGWTIRRSITSITLHVVQRQIWSRSIPDVKHYTARPPLTSTRRSRSPTASPTKPRQHHADRRRSTSRARQR